MTNQLSLPVKGGNSHVKGSKGLYSLVLGVLGLLLTIAMFPKVLDGFVALRNTSHTEVDLFEDVETLVGVAEDNVTLSATLLGDDVANVSSINSTDVTDVPVANSYSGLILNVTGLTENITAGRDLRVTYEHGVLSYFTALDVVTTVVPTVLFLVLLTGSGYLVASGIRKRSAG